MSTVKKTVYIFMGPPGSGKGSLAALCKQRLGWKHISAGNLCREEIAKGSEIGKQIDFTIKSGKLISDSLIVQMVANALDVYLESESNSLILDGFPRTVCQARELDGIMQQEKFSQAQLVIVRVFVPDEVIVKRIARRLVCPNSQCQAVYSASDEVLSSGKPVYCDECGSVLQRRSDDTSHVIEERLKCYHEEEKHLLAFYATKDYRSYNLNLEIALEDAFQQLIDLLGITNNDKQ